MIVVLDERLAVADGYVALFRREGVAASTIALKDVPEWLRAVSAADLVSIEAFLVGQVTRRAWLCQHIAERTKTVMIATREANSLEETLELFAAGFDDVVRKPIHVREIMARIRAVARRSSAAHETLRIGEIQVFCDGRDPVVAGETLLLPRRERRILEFLMSKSHCRVSKAQIFHAVYGLFDDGIDENVVESHISKLRKRLRERLGYDPIDSKRFLGYRIMPLEKAAEEPVPVDSASYAQADCGLMLVQH